MAEIRVRFRTDSYHYAELKAIGRPRVDRYINTGREFEHLPADQWDAIPPAQPGDLWRTRWWGHPESIAGYAIGCPTCRRVHAWTNATNCGSRRIVNNRPTCAHMEAFTSCWRWTGSAEDGTLSASPSLWCQKERGGCGFHGFLTNGVLRG